MRVSLVVGLTLLLPGLAIAQPMRTPDLYATEGEAKAHCGNDVVVWINSKSHVFHDRGTRYYGHTDNGGYMCRMVADRSGYRHAVGE